jgi:hypothetical protein
MAGSESEHDGEMEIKGAVFQTPAGRVIANHLVVRQGAAKSVEANELVMRQAAALRAQADRVSASSSGIGYIQTQEVDIQTSKVGVITASGKVKIDQTASYAVVSNGDTVMDQSAALFVVSPKVSLHDTSTVFLFAKTVEGNVTTLFGSKDAVLFGAVAGLVGGMFVLISRLFRRK